MLVVLSDTFKVLCGRAGSCVSVVASADYWDRVGAASGGCTAVWPELPWLLSIPAEQLHRPSGHKTIPLPPHTQLRSARPAGSSSTGRPAPPRPAPPGSRPAPARQSVLQCPLQLLAGHSAVWAALHRCTMVTYQTAKETGRFLAHWENPVASTGVLATVLAILVSICYFSFISVLAYLSLAALAAIMAVKVYSFAMVFMKKVSLNKSFFVNTTLLRFACSNLVELNNR